MRSTTFFLGVLLAASLPVDAAKVRGNGQYVAATAYLPRVQAPRSETNGAAATVLPGKRVLARAISMCEVGDCLAQMQVNEPTQR